MILFLDDGRTPEHLGYPGAVWVTTAEQAITLLLTGGVTFASLDHDLGTTKTGYDVVCWLEDHPEYWPQNGVRVHSMNPVGRERMVSVIKGHYGRSYQ